MIQYQYATEVVDIFKIARSRAIELGQETLSSEIILDAIIRHGSNSGVTLLEQSNTKMSMLKGLLAERMEETRRTPNVEIAAPNVSMQVRFIMDFAGTISGNRPVDAAALVRALFRAPDSVASSMLSNSGYAENGMKGRPYLEGGFRKSGTPIINQFATDLTEMAMMGKLDPVIGRESEIAQIIKILARRKKNNPMIIGEPGVGKTSLVEGLAMRIINEEVPELLKNKRVVSLNLNSVVAGTQYRGQFEERMQKILAELERNPQVIVFIDEIHTLMGNGGNEGTGDSAQIIKPALARGSMKCIGATTLNEYRKHIEKDGALERRFQKVLVDPPTDEQTLTIITNIKSIYELFHGITFTDGALKAVVNLSERYITDKNFPDKAIDILDSAATSCQLQAKSCVEEQDVQAVVAEITGIPVTNLGKSERERLKTIVEDLNKVVIGQEEGIEVIAQAIKRTRTGIRASKRPSSFLFLGPTGIGKTETARQLAKYLFDNENSLIRVDMSEFSEKFTVSALIGAPPGYVGYEEGGKLTEAVRRKPYSVVLLDEIEKAHPDVFNILLQVLDDGMLTDSAGRRIDFKNTIIIITSNLGTATAHKGILGFGAVTREEESQKYMTEALEGQFRPEFLNRLDAVVTYHSLTKEHIKKILGLYIKAMNSNFEINFSEEADDYFATKGYSEKFGARPLRRLLEKEVETRIADLLLDTPDAKQFNVDVVDDQLRVSIK
jgi:ATP-dependent Clp protease ATP-binding subunit ClpC